MWINLKTQKIEIDGIVKFFEELGLDLMDATTLIISYYFGAKKSVWKETLPLLKSTKTYLNKQGEYTKEGFCNELSKLSVNTVADFKKKIPQFKQEL